MNVELIMKKVDWSIKSAQEQLEKFKTSLDKDPMYAFDWSGDAISAAVEFKMLTDIKAAIEKGCTVEKLIEHLTDIALREARYPSRSTSPMSNLIAQEKASFAIKFVDELKYY